MSNVRHSLLGAPIQAPAVDRMTCFPERAGLTLEIKENEVKENNKRGGLIIAWRAKVVMLPPAFSPRLGATSLAR